MNYAEIAVDAPIHSTFDYHIPDALLGKIQMGHLVQVSFGTGKLYGVVMRLHDQPQIAKTKPISERVDPTPVLTPAQIDVARWMSAYYLAPMGLCVWNWLPPGLTSQRDVEYAFVEPSDYTPRTDLEAEIIALLRRRGALRSKQLNTALPAKPWRAALDAMVKAGYATREAVLLPPKVKPKMIQTAALAVHPDQIATAVKALEKTSKPADFLEALANIQRGQTFVTLSEVTRRSNTTRAHAEKLVEAQTITLDGDAVALAIPHEQVSDKLIELRRIEKPLRVLNLLAREKETIDLDWVYAQTETKLADLRKLDEAGLVHLGERHEWRDSLSNREFIPAQPPRLTGAQDSAWNAIKKTLMQAQTDQSAQTFLLHGVTGSGKTEIYLRAIELALALDQSAIILVPEIALTAQTIRRVASRFPGLVGVVHSALTEGERYDTWRKARTGLIRVVVGARSALFTPLQNVGLIILDEEHDPSYKHSPPMQAPYYHARMVAEKMIHATGGVVILGSATPSVETTFRAAQGLITRVELPRRIMGHRQRIREQVEAIGVQTRYRPEAQGESDPNDAVMIDLPPVRIVDMREELRHGNTSIFSKPLQVALAEVIERKQQAILFLNRRGQATYVFCRDCGYVVKCPRCDTPLTYHRSGESLRCHRCDFSAPPPTLCAECGSKRIKFFGAGTQQVEQFLMEQFPRVRAIRWDADTATSPAAHEAILQRFIERKADIMIGTQMVAKGLDLPMVTLVGVVSADTGLALPDFSGNERTFQILTQVAGRAGRGLLGGQVILQTYQPEHYAITYAAQHDYTGFYHREIEYRRDLGYPPFRRFVRILFRFNSEREAVSEARRAAEIITQRLEELGMTGTEIIGPAPCFFTRENQVFRWHILLRGPDPTAALKGMDIPKGWFVDVDPVDVL